jgi:hypothetical protein
MRKRAVLQWVARECICRVRSQDYNFFSRNRITTRRQPGSAMKVFVSLVIVGHGTLSEMRFRYSSKCFFLWTGCRGRYSVKRRITFAGINSFPIIYILQGIPNYLFPRTRLLQPVSISVLVRHSFRRFVYGLFTRITVNRATKISERSSHRIIGIFPFFTRSCVEPRRTLLKRAGYRLAWPLTSYLVISH